MILTPYAVAFRYPGDLPELSHQEAEDAFSLAQFVWDSIIKKLDILQGLFEAVK